MSVGQFCNREVIVARRSDPVPDLARLMREYHVGDLVVVESIDAPVPVGMVTDRDLVVEVLAADIEPASLTAGDIMSYDLLVAREGDSLCDTLKRMRARGVRRVPVVDDQHGRLVGIITVDDVLEVLADELSALARIPERERVHEQEARP
ncbi:MAG: CBS domain-containing protein [Thiohalomonadaceae bacterium]